MLIQSFLKWSETAKVAERSKAARALANAYVRGAMAEEERRAAEAAIAMLVEDASPKVRIALSETLAHSHRPPRAVMLALANDQIEVAGHVIAFSPVLNDSDLVDIVATGRTTLQQLAAHRRPLGVAVCAAIAEVGVDLAVMDMLDNERAHVAGISLKRLAERFGDHPEIRAQLLDRDDLPCAVRQSLVERLGAALAGFNLGQSTIGGERLRKVTEEACRDVTLKLTETVPANEMPALVEHLRMAGKLTPAFLMHALCSGNVDFFAAAIISLSGVNERRVRGLLVEGREAAIRALYREAGLSANLVAPFLSATLMWRQASRSAQGVEAADIAERLVVRHARDAETDPAIADLLRLVEAMHVAWQRQASRAYATRLIAQAA
ncbi:MAG: hypothetical protein CML29_12880 [Rhizobiales bacterium]|nr:hypothetical protein [Hyphomicrobiales bacterium]MBG18545.1 hypothetical protein [Hyphomicrobiales bacterium]